MDDENVSHVGGSVVSRTLEDELKTSYLRYSMSVIISRALPDVRDGLKPSQRRILFAMRQLNLSPGAKHRKCAKIAGDTSGDYHPHGETVIYPTLVRMAQPWIMRYSLVNGQGNFGSVDGDPPAAMRYTEARLTAASMLLMEDLDKETVDFVPNYDETRKEPLVFPSKFPNLLCNGSSGIAVGMATNIPPHNLSEVINATTLVIDNPLVSIEEIMTVLPGPDFPTGGIICGTSSIKEAFNTGRGKLKVRGVCHVEEQEKSDRSKIVIDEIPYNVNKSTLVSRIAALVNDKTMTGVSDIRDESDKRGMRVVLDLKRGEVPDVIINQLYKYTDMQVTFGCNMLALDNGLPRTMNIKQFISSWVDHRIDVVKKRTRFELKKAAARAHLLEGYLKALDHLGAIVNLIKSSKDRSEAKIALVKTYELSERQADAVLDLRLYQLTGLEREKLEDEYKSLVEKIRELKAILASEELVKDIIKSELAEIKKLDKLPRQTQIVANLGEEFQMEDLITNEPVIITISSDDYIKRMPIDTFREQKRGGHGVIGVEMKKETDFLKDVYVANTHHTLVVFTNFGRCYWLKVWQIPEGGRRSKGKAIINLLDGISKDETVAAVLRVANFEEEAFILCSTKRGIIKKTKLDCYSSQRKSGVYAIKIDDGDELISARLVNTSDQIMLFTRFGMAVRFDQSIVRPIGRVSRGVKGISLKNDEDVVVSCAVVSPEHTVLIVCEKGFGKRSKVGEFRQTNRGGKGVRSIITNKRNGFVLGAIAIKQQDSVLMMSNFGQTLRTAIKDIRVMGRSTQGVRLVQIPKDASLVGLQKIENLSQEENLDEEKNDYPGLFITVEGCEGSGKSTLIDKLYAYLVDECKKFVVKTFEPGGTPFGEQLRLILLKDTAFTISSRTELFLFLADRAHHVETLIRPALEQGMIVISDRFTDSSIAYQGFAREESNLDQLETACSLAACEIVPDLTVYLDMDAEAGLSRLKATKDRLESETTDFHKKVRVGYLALAKRNSKRFFVIDASQSQDAVYEQALSRLRNLIPTGNKYAIF